MAQHRLVLASLILAASCTAFATVAEPARAYTIAHLYVAVGSGGSFSVSAKILRFRLRDGVITHTPDLTYDGYGAPLAVSPTGMLYAGSGIITGYGAAGAVFAFLPGSTKPSHLVDIYPVDGRGFFYGATAIALDASGYLALGYVSSGLYGIQSIGFMLYAPSARRGDAPLSIEPASGYVPGVAFDRRGRLYVAEQHAKSTNAVRVFASPETQPRYLASISGGPFHERDSQIGGIAIDAANELYAYTLRPTNRGPISAFSTNRFGVVPPDRTFAPFAGNGSTFPIGIAVDAAHAYEPYFFASKNGGRAGVFELDKFANGTVKVADALQVAQSNDPSSIAFVQAVAVGP